MSFAAAVALAVGVLVGMFALLFGLAFVEQRLFDDVMIDPVEEIVDAASEGPALHRSAPPADDDLRHAA